MILPNMMIIGAQKCGTTWLHRALDKSDHFWGSEKKELSFWSRPAKRRDLADYSAHFAARSASARFVYESTPHYFRLPKPRVDTAKEIREGLGDIPLILLLRDPVERYLSAYTHHIMRERFPVVDEIDDYVDDLGLVSLGDYHSILLHFQRFFSKIHIYLYDDIVADPMALIETVFRDFDVPLDIGPDDIAFRTNDKTIKAKDSVKKGITFPNGLPGLSMRVMRQLDDTYHAGLVKLRDEFGLNVTPWLDRAADRA